MLVYVRIGVQPDLLRHKPELMDHRRRHFLQALRARELVGVGEQIALKRFGLRRQIRDQLGLGFGTVQEVGGRSKARVFHRFGDVEHRIAFGDSDTVEVDIAARDAPVDLWQTRLPLEAILAGLQGWPWVQHVPERENQFAPDHARLLQLRGNPARRIPRTQEQRRIGWRGNWDIELPCGPAADGENNNQKQFNQRAQGSSVKGFQNPRWKTSITTNVL